MPDEITKPTAFDKIQKLLDENMADLNILFVGPKKSGKSKLAAVNRLDGAASNIDYRDEYFENPEIISCKYGGLNYFQRKI